MGRYIRAYLPDWTRCKTIGPLYLSAWSSNHTLHFLKTDSFFYECQWIELPTTKHRLLLLVASFKFRSRKHYAESFMTWGSNRKMFSRIPWFIPRFKFETFLQCEEVAYFPLFRKVCMPMRKFQHKVLLQKLHNEPRARSMFELNVLDFLAINVTVIAGVSLPFKR